MKRIYNINIIHILLLINTNLAFYLSRKTSVHIILIVLTIMSFSSISTVDALSDVVIISSSYYVTESGYSHVAGEVQNIGTVNVYAINISVIFYVF